MLKCKFVDSFKSENIILMPARARFIVFLFFLFSGWNSLAQKKYIALYRFTGNPAIIQPELETVFTNRLTCSIYLEALGSRLQKKGYLAASIDTIIYGTDTVRVSVFTGIRYEWVELDITENEPEVLLRCGWDANQLKNGNLQIENLWNLQKRMLDYYQENGFPFVKIRLDRMAIDSNKIKASLITSKGETYKIDSIRLFGSAKISNTFIQKQLGIKNGSLYKKSLLDGIPKKIQDLPYLQQQFPYNLTMLSTSAVVNLYLQPRKSSILNVLLGVIPQPNPNGLNQVAPSRLFISGDANILLHNVAGLGETIGLNYQQLSVKSRRVHLLYKHPYFLKSNYGIDGLFEMYKRDSAYLNIEAQLGVGYNLGQNTQGRLFMQVVKTNSYPDTATIRLTRKLPDNLDIKFYNLGFQYEWDGTDFRRNPSKGSTLSMVMAFGTKKIFSNSGVDALKDPGFDFQTLYDSIKRNTYQFKLKTTAAHYFKIRKQTVLKTAFQGGLLLSQNYFRNELFQIGGFKVLRGFDEESQFCNQYAVGTAEYRYLVAPESYFFVFADGGVTKNQVAKAVDHRYLGLGAGMNFMTKSGLFNLSIAVGTRNEIPFGLKQARLHFGYVNVF
jgi:outer membrane protein assembly factor BamA